MISQIVPQWPDHQLSGSSMFGASTLIRLGSNAWCESLKISIMAAYQISWNLPLFVPSLVWIHLASCIPASSISYASLSLLSSSLLSPVDFLAPADLSGLGHSPNCALPPLLVRLFLSRLPPSFMACSPPHSSQRIPYKMKEHVWYRSNQLENLHRIVSQWLSHCPTSAEFTVLILPSCLFVPRVPNSFAPFIKLYCPRYHLALQLTAPISGRNCECDNIQISADCEANPEHSDKPFTCISSNWLSKSQNCLLMAQVDVIQSLHLTLGLTTNQHYRSRSCYSSMVTIILFAL